MSLAPPIKLMLGIPPIKMVMNGEWFKFILLPYQDDFNQEQQLGSFDPENLSRSAADPVDD